MIAGASHALVSARPGGLSRRWAPARTFSGCNRPVPSWRRATRVLAAPSLEGLPYPLEELLEEAEAVVERCCRLCTNVRAEVDRSSAGSSDQQLKKVDSSPVTVADFGVQALISLELGALFPSVGLLAEEDSAELRTGGPNWGMSPLVPVIVRHVNGVAGGEDLDQEAVLAAIDRGKHAGGGDEPYWILDPIDGTRGFLRGGEAQYAVGLALAYRGEVVLGVMGAPNFPRLVGLEGPGWPAEGEDPEGGRGLLVSGARGLGAWRRGLGDPSSRLPAQVDEGAADLQKDCHVACISESERWSELLWAELCCGSLVKYLAVVTGAASSFVQHPIEGKTDLKVWDHASAVPVLEEAGGVVVDLLGAPLELAGGRKFSPGGMGVLVSNRALAPQLLELHAKGGVAPLDGTGRA